jgi:hypothetical protein
MLIYTHCWELMNSVGSHGSLSLPFMMKVMVCHFVSDSHEVMAALIVILPLIVVVEISLQLHQASFCVGSVPPRLTEDRGSEEGTAQFSSSEYASTNTELLSNRRDITPYKVACCICITDQSSQPGVSTLLVIFPPRCMNLS